jgi:seryl-tRNA synthetase
MLDIKWIRENPELFDEALKKRKLEPLADQIIKLDTEKRHSIAQIQELQQQRNNQAKMLGQIKDKTGIEFQKAKEEAGEINKKLDELNAKSDSDKKLEAILETLPNIIGEEVPLGEDESHNKIIRTVGIIPDIANPKEHFELGENLGLMDFEQTAKISGSRFVTLTGGLARLERALASFMLDIHTNEFDYLEVSPPALVRPSAMYNTGQLPNLEEESFVTTNDYRLIPTAEVSLTNLVADKIIAREELPIRFTAYTPCFRSEAGSAGKDTRGMIRVHQFNKVEMVSITTPDESEAEHQRMLSAAETILQRLKLPYRVMLLCSGDTGFCSKKTFDLEVWLPGQNQYREISSVSNCSDFQARRLKARYKEFGASETTLVHTLNGSGLAVGRTLIAVLENYQNQDGSIRVPDVLVPYMGGLTRIN